MQLLLNEVVINVYLQKGEKREELRWGRGRGKGASLLKKSLQLEDEGLATVGRSACSPTHLLSTHLHDQKQHLTVRTQILKF